MPPPRVTPEWRESLVARAALETGLLEAFSRPCDPAEAARAAGLDARATRIVAAALRALGYLEDDEGGRLRLASAGRDLLRPPDDDRDPAGEILLEARAIASHLRLPEALRSGTPVDDVSGGDRATRERFMRAMRHIAGRRAPDTVAAIGPPPPGGRLLDVGGAPGTYARAFAAAGWDVTVLDLSGALEAAGDGLRAAGIHAVGGDATVALPPGPWDAVYLGNVVHLLGREEAAALLRRAGAALRLGGLLAVQEVLGDRSPQGPGFGVMMLLSTDAGDAYPERDYLAWMAAAGCAVERSVALEEGWHHLLLGRRGP